MIATPRVVIVDNNKDELEQLHQALVYAGIPAIPILYDAEAWPPELLPDTTSVRLMFLDLNLLHGTPSTGKAIAPLVARVMSTVVTTGPYLLVFWSKHKEIADDVMAILRERHPEILPPLRHMVIDKLEFQVRKHDQEEVKKLATKINGLLSAVPILDALVRWEDRVGRAAASTVSRLYELAAGHDKWDALGTEARLANLMTWIAHEAIGRKSAGENPGQAAEQGLVYGLSDELNRTAGEAAYEKMWKAAMPQVGAGRFSPERGLSPAALNEVFSIDTRGVQKSSRGAFVTISDALLGDAAGFQRVFGYAIKDLKMEFVNLASVEKSGREDLLGKCQLGLVELSAACDYAQRKARSLRYCLAALIPAELAASTLFWESEEQKAFPRKVAHDAVYRLPPLQIRGRSVICKLNFRHILGLAETSPVLAEPLFRIRVPLLDEIAYKCSAHLARPGTIAFRDE